jgi:RNA polymerase sigma-70 factor (ECF subfamily)
VTQRVSDAWERLPERLGQSPESVAVSRELLTTLREGIDTVLTPHQRRVFAAIVLNGSPLDALVAEMDTNRNAIYKTVFDARKKLHGFLVDRGQIDP